MEDRLADPRWRLEVNNPNRTADWKVLWEFDDDQIEAYKTLIGELNRINAPVQLRMVRSS